MSFCCWVKLNEINKTPQTLFCSRIKTGAGLFIFITSNNQLRFDNGNDTNTSANQTTFNYDDFVANTWYHIAVIQTNTQKKLYINGILQQSINKASANSGSNSAIKCTIGGSGNNNATGNWLDGYLNDVRIYNHALSDKEVEEIAKGLVLHYKLDGENMKNLLINSSSKTAIVTDTTNNVYTGYWYLNSSYQDFIIKGTTLTVEYDYNIDLNTITTTNSNLNLYSQFNTSIISPAQRLYYEDIVTNPIGHKRDTFIITQAQADYASSFRFRIRLQNANEGATFTISNIKMYFGTYNNIIHDSSGYGNNGTITGSLETVTPSPRYNCATYFDGSSIIAIGTQLYNMKDEMTISLWINKDWSINTGTPFSSVQAGGFGWQVNNTNYTFYCGTGTTSNTYISTAITINNLSSGWHMLSATYDGLALKLYIDGVLKSTTTKYSTKTPLFYNQNSGMFVGGESNGSINTTSTDRFIGDLSDLRIYGVALTDDQIKELYNTSASIDNQGNAYARELVE